MTSYTSLSDANLAVDKPITQSIARAWRDNPLAIAEGDITAPKIFGLNGDVEVTATNATDLTWTGTFDSDFDVVTIEIAGVGPQSFSANQRLEIQGTSNSGSSWGTPVTLVNVGNIGGGGNGIGATFQLFRPHAASIDKYFCGWLVNPTIGGGADTGFKSGQLLTAAALNGIRFRIWNTSSGAVNNMNGRMTIRTHRRASNV